jgi:hypothetical protein
MHIQSTSAGHTWAKNGALLRIDVMGGMWVATRFTGCGANLAIAEQHTGTCVHVHNLVKQWEQ